MDNDLRGAAAETAPYDYRKYDKVWQRVAPSLNPYPGAVPAAEMGGIPQEPASPAAPPAQPAPPAVSTGGTLPGAAPNPCCMGTAAQEMLEVLEGFIEDALSDRRYYQAFLRQAPPQARQVLRGIAMDKGAQIRRLLAVYYLITGKCYQPSVSCDRIYIGAYCAALRERYHVEACGWMNYARAAEGTTDPCLQKIFTELSGEGERHARLLSGLLERALAGTCGSRQMGV